MSIKHDIFRQLKLYSIRSLDDKDLNDLRHQLDSLPEKPTVLITVEGGVATYTTLPEGKECPVNIVLIDLDQDSLDPVRVQREE